MAVVCAVAVIAGVALSALFPSSVSFVCTALSIALLYLILKRRTFSRFQIILYTATFLFAVSTLPLYCTLTTLDRFADDYSEESIMHGRITEITDETDRVRVTMTLLKIKNDNETSRFPLKKQIYVYTDKPYFKDASPGDEIIMKGKFTPPEEAMNPGDFNARRYYLSINIAGFCYDPTDVKIYPGYFYPPSILHTIRNFSKTSLNTFTGGENYDFVTAVLLGDRSGFSDQLTENSRKIGISHVTAVSGMHVSILISLILIITKPLTKRRKTKAKIVVAVLLFYMALSGLSPSVIRASVMGCCCMAGVLTGRRAKSLSLLLLCAAVMLIINPFLLYNPSFMLSFISSAGLSIFTPILKNKIKHSSMLLDTLLMTVIANVTTLPYVLWNFDYYSWIGLLANLLIVPLISAVFIGGFLTVVLCPIPILSAVSGAFTQGICSIILTVTNSIAQLPFGQTPSILHNVFYLFAIILFISMVYFMFADRHRLTGIFFTLTILSMCTGLVVDFAARNPFTVTYLYVGQGDSAVIQMPGGAIYLVDVGDVSATGRSRCLDYLNNHGIRKIEGIILSHEDADHAGALEAIVSKVKTKHVYISENSLLHRNVSQITNTAARYGCELKTVNSGDSLCVNNDATFSFIYPPSSLTGLDSNNSSIVTELCYKGKVFLFTGDISAETEKQILPLLRDCDVLKVAHHGAYTSTSRDFLADTTPEFAVISAGINNSYSHPNTSTTSLLAEKRIQTFITNKHGAVRFRVSSKGQLIQPERR